MGEKETIHITSPCTSFTQRQKRERKIQKNRKREKKRKRNTHCNYFLMLYKDIVGK